MAPKKVKKVDAKRPMLRRLQRSFRRLGLVPLWFFPCDAASRRRLGRRDSDEQVNRLVAHRLSELTATDISGDKSIRLIYTSFLIIG